MYAYQIVTAIVTNCPAIVTKLHFGGITTVEPEGVEDCSFAAEPRTVSTSNIPVLHVLNLHVLN